ncbi:MAG: ATP-dependent DNA helicase RecQ [Gemmatimonadales bacterium]|nr:ATP-dependent DNA helicase RecQ [Gemmatimonadales bacterium]
MTIDLLDRALHTHFQLTAFRPGQREAVEAVLAGRDVIAVMPTGAGKSLCFQLPAMLLDGVTIVVSPLIALMKDQVDVLRGRGIAAAAVHSMLSPGERQDIERELADGRLRLVYVAPERLASPAFRSALARARPSRLVIDEAHCISQWGHDFRPDYRRLGALRTELGVPVAAFTATATPDVRADIGVQLGLASPLELVTGFERPNLTLAVESCRGRGDKIRALESLIRDAGLPGIVYASTRKNVELWAEVLESSGLRAGRYHAGLSDDERTRVQDDFLSGRIDAIAATNAFGMGIDKRDIRFVAHADLPGSVEAYYQEAGRAGRDGAPSRCTLLFSPADVRTQEFFLSGGNPSAAMFRRVWALLGEGASDEEVEERVGEEATERMAAVTAARLLRRAAEAAAIPFGSGSPPVDLSLRSKKARRDRDRLDTIIRYGFARGCRTRFIYDYFAGGARGGAEPQCGTCDVCLGWRRGTGRELSDAEYEQVRIALSGVGRLSGRFGVERIAQVLVGSHAHEVLSRGLDGIPTFGKLAALGIDRVKALLATLADAGLVERRAMEGGRPGVFVLALSADGRRVAMGETRPQLALEYGLASEGAGAGTSAGPAARSRRKRGGASAPAELGDADPELVLRLKSWRTEEARRKSVPPYVIFHDKTLIAIAAARPQNRDGLLRVKGMGDAKLDAYGDALLQLLDAG